MQQYRYQQLAKTLKQRISNGDWQAGKRVPSVRTLCQQQQLSKATVLHALHLLEAEGILEARPKSGYFVKAKQEIAPELPQASISPPTPLPVNVPSIFRYIMKHSAAFDILPSAGGDNPSAHQIALNRHIGRALRRHPETKSMYYNEPSGDLGLRTQISEHYRQQGLNLSPEQLCITAGCQNALFLALMATCQPGDNVIVESPAFYGVLQLLEQLQLKVIEIPASPQTGLDINAMELALKNWQVTACIVTPAFATPTGATMPQAHRQQLMSLANTHDIAIIEDDIYGDLAFDGRPSPLKKLDEQERVILCSSFSKSLSRDLRIGWIVGSRWHEKVTHLKLVTQLASNQALQEGLTSFLADGHYRRHLHHYRQQLKQQRDQLIQAIRQYWPASTRFTSPAGGLALWLEMDDWLDLQAAYPIALKQGIILTPGPLFSASGEYRHYMRLSFTHPINTAREQALEKLANLLQITPSQN